ncbi:MAG: 3-deoxy-D-manno-octulosonic acid kinase [Gammaproteobacteria bacterium]|nr:3-deoxy-D-manno-octulosonic acid kinase [Gammaproteobacteria bacterium]
MSNWGVVKHGRHVIVSDTSLFPDISPDYFNDQYWRDSGMLLETRAERGISYFFKHSNQEFVLRHYRRSGRVARVTEDLFLNLGANFSRAFREFKVLQQLYLAQLPVPRPAAARVEKRGIFLTGDIITMRLPNTAGLHLLLTARDFNSTFWRRLGATIRRFHDFGLFHADLTLPNILVDDDENIWLIDFDRARLKPQDEKWRQANLSRLRRSFSNQRKLLGKFHWREDEWQDLLDGYSSA